MNIYFNQHIKLIQSYISQEVNINNWCINIDLLIQNYLVTLLL